MSSGKILLFEGYNCGGELNAEVNGELLCCPGIGDRGGDRCIGALFGWLVVMSRTGSSSTDIFSIFEGRVSF
jgi:hypothetical protein